MHERIVCDPNIMGGKPTIKGTRLSVEFIMELVESGGTKQRIVERYPRLTIDDVEQAISYAASNPYKEIDLQGVAAS